MSSCLCICEEPAWRLGEEKSCGLHFIALGTVSLVPCRICSRYLREQFKLGHWPWPGLFCVLRFLQLKASSPFCSLPSWCLNCTSERSMCKFFSSLEPLHCTVCDVNKTAPGLQGCSGPKLLTFLVMPFTLNCLFLTYGKLKYLWIRKSCAISWVQRASQQHKYTTNNKMFYLLWVL